MTIPNMPNDKAAAARLAGLLDSAMDAIISVDESQRVVIYNRAAEKIFGYAAAEMIGQPLAKLLPERFRNGHAEHVQRFGKTGVTSRRMSGSQVVFGRRANGEEFPVDASISQVDTPEGKLYTVILRDVTERMEAEQEQTRLAARLSGLLEAAMDGIITIDESQRIIFYNRSAEKIFGWSPVQVIGRPLDMLMPKRFRGGHKHQVRTFGDTGVTSRRMGSSAVIHGLRANGEEFPLDASISQIDTAEGKLYTVILRDITERMRAQQELAAFAAEASGVREQEKSRIARELHDELAQTLTALKMDTLVVRDSLPAGQGESSAKLDEMLRLLDSAVASTRRIAADLRPLVLDDLGLLPAIEWLGQNFTQRTGIDCAIDASEEFELREPYATAIFRIVQESLNNVAKHAQASHVDVALARRGDEIVVSVQDNGSGFRLSEPRKPHSLGLVGLRERALLLRGKVDVASEPGMGTRVEARIPVREGEGMP
ncbi:MAG TPA: PAS domain S-box protein [Ramlibacter sp.]|uniref:PAS domain-containing sensor histidine kinase n=1 Tax=Ramlibacter sp. TaxID=1917967 RepID=UPI002B8AF5CD|nr:PAS domain S-box protein [Ramlibacter sp.]HVZ43711.1 PAS domain S-box protein [Ramlibacter sp.]